MYRCGLAPSVTGVGAVRYYVNTVVVGHKLPEHYPIRHQLLAVMEALARAIRQRQTAAISYQRDGIGNGRIQA